MRADTEALIACIRMSDRGGERFRALPDRATQRTPFLRRWPRAVTSLNLVVCPWGAMADIVKYHGCSIIVHSDVTMEGKVLGSYEIIADAPETVAAFAERGITRLRTVVGVDPQLPDRDYLVEMAKCEIDFVLEVAF